LQVASVVGRVFTFQTLTGAHAFSDVSEVIKERLNYLGNLGLTENLELEIYRFIHLTTREVVYESLSYDLRRSLHRGIGDFIERTFGESVSEQVDMLAYHYFEGQDWTKALDYNLQSGQHAQREFANDIAITSCQRALEAAAKQDPEVDTTSEQISANETLGEVLTLVGRYDDALEHYGLARGFVENAEPSTDQVYHLADLCRKTADVYERRSEYDVAFEWLDKGLNYLSEEAATIEATRIYLLGAGLYHRQGKNDQATVWCDKSLDAASQIDTRDGKQALAQGFYLLGAICYRLGDLQCAADHCKTSIQTYQEIDDFVGQARAFNNLAIAYSDLGEWDQSSEAYHKSLSINQRIGNIMEGGFVANNLGNIHLYWGDWDHAIELFKQSNAVWKQIGAALPDAVTLSNMAQVYIYQKDWENARECLTQSQELFDEIGSEDLLPELERRWGEYYLKTGELDKAQTHTQRSLDLATEQEARFEAGVTARVSGEVLMARDELHAADSALRRSLQTLREMDSEYQAAKTMVAIVRLALAREGVAPSRELLDHAIQIFGKLRATADLEDAQALEAHLQETGLYNAK
jgi:tetratricopeptide (TPR) repeat protein